MEKERSVAHPTPSPISVKEKSNVGLFFQSLFVLALSPLCVQYMHNIERASISIPPLVLPLTSPIRPSLSRSAIASPPLVPPQTPLSFILGAKRGEHLIKKEGQWLPLPAPPDTLPLLFPSLLGPVHPFPPFLHPPPIDAFLPPSSPPSLCQILSTSDGDGRSIAVSLPFPSLFFDFRLFPFLASLPLPCRSA